MKIFKLERAAQKELDSYVTKTIVPFGKRTKRNALGWEETQREFERLKRARDKAAHYRERRKSFLWKYERQYRLFL